MAKIKSGINGIFSGKVGNIVGSSWNGIDYIKSAPRRIKPATDGEKINRFIFKMVQHWLSPLQEILKVGFKGYSRTCYGMNAAKSLLYKTALIKDGYNSYIDPSLVLISYGSLDLPDNIEVELNNQKELIFSWDTANSKNKYPKDQALLLAYKPGSKIPPKMSVPGEFRKTGIEKLDLSNSEKGVHHIYIGFVAEDRSRQSNSCYLGSVNID